MLRFFCSFLFLLFFYQDINAQTCKNLFSNYSAVSHREINNSLIRLTGALGIPYQSMINESGRIVHIVADGSDKGELNQRQVRDVKDAIQELKIHTIINEVLGSKNRLSQIQGVEQVKISIESDISLKEKLEKIERASQYEANAIAEWRFEKNNFLKNSLYSATFLGIGAISFIVIAEKPDSIIRNIGVVLSFGQLLGTFYKSSLDIRLLNRNRRIFRLHQEKVRDSKSLADYEYQLSLFDMYRDQFVEFINLQPQSQLIFVVPQYDYTFILGSLAEKGYSEAVYDVGSKSFIPKH